MQFVYAVLLGAVMGVVFEIFRTIRVMIFHKDVVVFFEDVLFTVIFSLGFFTYCGVMAAFSLRWFILAGMILGFVTYLLTAGELVRAIVKTLVIGLKSVIRGVLKVLYKLFAARIVNFFVSFGHSAARRFVQNKSTLKKIQKSRSKPLKRKADLLYNDT